MAIKSPSDMAKKSPVKIRFKSLADGCKSIYLDIYVKALSCWRDYNSPEQWRIF